MIQLAFTECDSSTSYFVSHLRLAGQWEGGPLDQWGDGNYRASAGGAALAHTPSRLRCRRYLVDLCPLGNMERVKSYLLLLSAVFVFVVAS